MNRWTPRLSERLFTIMKDFVVNPLLEEPMVVALPSTHLLAQGQRGRALSVKRLANETFILYGPPGTGMYDATIAACHAAGFNPRVGQSRCVDPASSPDHVDPEPGCRGTWYFVCPIVASAHEHGRRRVSSGEGPGSTKGRAEPCVTSWRAFCGGETICRSGQASGQGFSLELREAPLGRRPWLTLPGRHLRFPAKSLPRMLQIHQSHFT